MSAVGDVDAHGGKSTSAPAPSLAKDTDLSIGQATLVALHEQWERVAWSSRRDALDAQLAALAENQEQSAQGRKALAEKTKTFRRLEDDLKLKSFGALVKSYQEEIDKLTRRAKASEAQFVSLVTTVADAGDPLPGLHAALQERSALETMHQELEETRGELSSYKSEIRDLKNQESTVRQLQQQLRDLEADAIEREGAAEERALRQAREEVAAEIAARDAREAELVQRVNAAEAEVAAAGRARAAGESEVLQQLQQESEALEAKQDELEIVQRDLDAAHLRIADLERQIESSRKISASADSRHSRSSAGSVSDAATPGEHGYAAENRRDLVETEGAAAEEQASSVISQADVDALTARCTAAEAALISQREELDRVREVLAERQRDLDNAQHELAARPSSDAFTALQKRCAAAESAAFDQLEDDVAAALTNKERETCQLLIEKNRRLGSELAQQRVQSAALEKRCTEAAEQASASAKRASSTQAHVVELERTIEALESAAVAAASREKPTRRDAAPVEPLLNDAAPSDPGSKATESAPGGEDDEKDSGKAEEDQRDAGAGAASLLAPSSISAAQTQPNERLEMGSAVARAVVAQRDRLRARVGALEQELRDARRRQASTDDEKSRLKADNVALYEKIRYLQSYGNNNPDSSARSARQPRDVEAGVEQEYARQYERRLDPFREFAERERTARERRLHVAERLTLSASRFFLGNPLMRRFIFVYTIALHILVLSMGWYVHEVYVSCHGLSHDVAHEAPDARH